MASEKVQVITDGNFTDAVLNASQPVLVDFWAEWCGPCKQVAPILDEIARDYAGKLTVAKVNVDENTLVANDYSVRGIPTLILFRGGKPVETKVGPLSRSQMRDWIEGAIGA